VTLGVGVEDLNLLLELTAKNYYSIIIIGITIRLN
jgi:hypothetical protein